MAISYTVIMDNGSRQKKTLTVDIDIGIGELNNSWDKWMWKVLEKFRETFFTNKNDNKIVKIKLK